MNATLHTFTGARHLILTLAAMHEADQIAAAWRVASQDVASDIIQVRGFLKVVAERDEMLVPGVPVHRPAYVDYCVKALPWALSLYLGNVRTISECEAAMTARGIPFAQSSDAWGY